MNYRKVRKKQKRKKLDKAKRQKCLQEQRQVAELEKLRETGGKLKPFLRDAGCDLRFYDFLDGFKDEFDRISETAIKERPSLLAIHEVSAAMLDETDWQQLGYGHFEQLDLQIDEKHTDYGLLGTHANIRGCASFFRGESGKLKSVVLVQKKAKASQLGSDLQYATKIAALAHEIGHVVDAERNGVIHFDGMVDIIEAEIFANVYALEFMAPRGLRRSYLMLYEALEELQGSDGYLGEVANGVIDRHAKVEIPDWCEYLDAARERMQVA